MLLLQGVMNERRMFSKSSGGPCIVILSLDLLLPGFIEKLPNDEIIPCIHGIALVVSVPATPAA